MENFDHRSILVDSGSIAHWRQETREKRDIVRFPQMWVFYLFWFLHALHVLRWGSVIDIWNSALPTILLAFHNLEMTTHVEDWDILKVCSQNGLIAPRLLSNNQNVLVLYMGGQFNLRCANRCAHPPTPHRLPFVCCRNLEKLKPCLLPWRRHRSNRKDRRDLRAAPV